MRSFWHESAKAIWHGILSNAAWWALVAVVSSSLVAVYIDKSRAWLFAKHTITAPGWLLVAIALLSVAGVFACIRPRIGRSRHTLGWKYKSKEDVMMRLEEHLNRLRSGPLPRHFRDFRLDYRDIDRTLLLKPGRTKRYLPAVVRKSRGWHIIRRGAKIVVIRYVVPGIDPGHLPAE